MINLGFFHLLKDKFFMTHLKAGDKAPEFSGPDQSGKIVSLTALRGKKVVLYFYPKDDTPGCTAEACNLRDNYQTLKKEGFEVLGVSMDDPESHRKFGKKYELPFRLIADTDQQIVHAYGVFGEKKLFGHKFMGIHRTTFLIDEKGTIHHIISKPDTGDHARQILEAWK